MWWPRNHFVNNHNRELLGDDEIFSVPKVIHSLTSKQVLTSELVYGVPLDQLTVADETIRNWVTTAKDIDAFNESIHQYFH